MSTPPGAGPGDDAGPEIESGPTAPWVPAYGQPSSPSYGKYGQGQALPPPPPPPPPPGPGWGQPGYHAPQRPAGPVPTRLTPVGAYQYWVAGLSSAFAAALVLGVLLAPNQHRVLQEALDGAPAPQLERGSELYRLVSSLALLVEVGLWVTTALWLTRVRQNALVLNPYGQRRSEVWVWLAWLVPVVNLWFPKQVVDDALSATASAGGRRRPGTALWWTAWLLAAGLNLTQFLLNLFPPNRTRHAVVAGLCIVVIAVALASWLRIVRWVSGEQDALARG
jgi:Domain of unknown function (DUF4328)